MPNTNVPETLSWTAPSQIEHARSSAWYLGLALVAIALLAFAIFYDRSIITVITFALVILVVFVLSIQPARQVSIKILKTGISVGTSIYPYKVIKTFWIFYSPPDVKTLNFDTTAYINNKVVVQLNNQDPLLVKAVLKQYLPEDLDREESTSEILARKLKI